MTFRVMSLGETRQNRSGIPLSPGSSSKEMVEVSILKS
jgi:hypothetical protein